MIKALGFLPGCNAGEHYDTSLDLCVPDTYGGGGTTTGGGGIDPKYLFYGLGFLLLLGAFMGGRASKKSSGGTLLSRTTTRSIFG